MAVAIGLWSIVVTPGEPTVVNAEGDIRITNCALGDELVDDSRTTLKLSYMSPGSKDSDDEDDEENEDGDEATMKTTVLCSLTGGKIEQASTDVIIEEGQEYLLEVVGKNTIYVTGNYIDQTPPTDFPPFGDSDDEDEFDLRDVGLGVGDEDEDMESDAGRFEEIVEEPKSGSSKRRASDVADTEETTSQKKTKKLKGADGEAAPAPAAEGEKSSKKEKKKKAKEAAATPAGEGKEEKKSDKASKELQGGVTIKDAKIGTGPQAKSGNTVSMRYIGKLQNGHVFDKNTKGKPFSFKLGGGEVIKGWDTGIAGMQVGGERLLTIPPGMGYGKRKMADIPANSTLIFEVKLVEIK